MAAWRQAMPNYRMILQYDGTRFNGWQRQSDTDNTIQGKLEAILYRLTGEEVTVNGAGRTDAGVHAKAQVAQFHLTDSIPPEDLRAYFNRYLPNDIGVTDVSVAAPRFHARYNAAKKTYRYRICKDKSKHVFDRKYMYLYPGEALDVEAMKIATIALRGEHDFKSFCGNPRMRKSTVKTLYAIHIRETDDEIILEFIGSGFLQYMVRIMVGTLIEVGEHRRDPYAIDALLAARDRKLAGPTAPACGLTMISVDYN